MLLLQAPTRWRAGIATSGQAPRPRTCHSAAGEQFARSPEPLEGGTGGPIIPSWDSSGCTGNEERGRNLSGPSPGAGRYRGEAIASECASSEQPTPHLKGRLWHFLHMAFFAAQAFQPSPRAARLLYGRISPPLRRKARGVNTSESQDRRLTGEKVFVDCAANKRVSCFISLRGSRIDTGSRSPVRRPKARLH